MALTKPLEETPKNLQQATAFGLAQKVALITMAMTAGITAGWFATPEESRAWWKANHLFKNIAGYATYMTEHPEGKHYETAACRKTMLENTPEAYRDYLYEFPEGTCRADAGQALARLEHDALAGLRANPTAADLRTFLIQFPECDNLDGVLRIVLENESLRVTYLPIIRQRWEECRLLSPAFPKIPVIEDAPRTDTAAKVPATPVPTPPPVMRTPLPKPAPTPGQHVPAPDLILLRGGTFPMGATNGLEDELPVRQVTLRDFYLGKTEVTFEEYDRFCTATGRNKPADEGWGRGNRPVIHISWLDATAYCNWLSAAHGRAPVYTFLATGSVNVSRTANGYRLPTEAEWEYAARCGQDYLYSGSENLNEVAWYLDNSGSQTHPVAHKAPNTCGLHDMTGNVREWCQDWYGRYTPGNSTDPMGPSVSKNRILRGGQWGRNPLQQRLTYRNSALPGYSDFGTGFRLARWE